MIPASKKCSASGIRLTGSSASVGTAAERIVGYRAAVMTVTATVVVVAA